MDASSWFVDTITVAAVSGRGNTGNPTFGSQTAVTCRVESFPGILSDSNGEDFTYSERIMTDTAIAIESRVWLPGADTADNTEAKRVVQVESAATKPGSYTLYRVYLR
jgi:hypothetical protein